MRIEDTNYERCEGGFRTLHRLWKKRCEIGIQGKPLYEEDCQHQKYGELDEAKWICAEADTALFFNIGDLVTYFANGASRYAVVTGYVSQYRDIPGHGSYMVYNSLKCKLADGSETRLQACDLKKSDIPSDILNLMKNRLAKDCPLKNPSCLS